MRTLLSLCLLLLTCVAFAQEPIMVEGKTISAKSAKKLIKQGKVYLLTSGMPATRGLSDEAKACREAAQKEFGFSYYNVGGDVTDPKKTKQINDFNEVVKKHLACRMGADWQTRLDAKLEECNKK